MTIPTAIITGTASGIGRNFAHTVKDRFRLTVADIRYDRLKADFGEETENLLPMEMDVSREEDWNRVLDATTRKFGRLDYLFNIAGVSLPRFIRDADASFIDRHMDVNAKGVMYGTVLAAKIMERQRSGHIVNIASLAGIAPVAGLSFYTASKYAVRGFSLTAAIELRPKNVYVTVICPDLVKTAMYDNQLTLPEESAITFSGPKKVLTVENLAGALLEAIEKKPIEITIPRSRGLLSKLACSVPYLSLLLADSMHKKGLRRIEEIKRSGRA
ncbi:MAG: SDR family oxidoreductase [bacterium]